METRGKLIARLRSAKGWSRARLGKEMAEAIGRKSAYSGEAVRRYEKDLDDPANDARKALAKVFELEESYIEFAGQKTAAANEPDNSLLEHIAATIKDVRGILARLEDSIYSTGNAPKDVLGKSRVGRSPTRKNPVTIVKRN